MPQHSQCAAELSDLSRYPPATGNSFQASQALAFFFAYNVNKLATREGRAAVFSF